MDVNDRKHRAGKLHADDAVDERIRRRFQSCVTMPLFAEPPPPLPPGFFLSSGIGPQLRLLDVRAKDRAK